MAIFKATGHQTIRHLLLFFISLYHFPGVGIVFFVRKDQVWLGWSSPKGEEPPKDVATLPRELPFRRHAPQGVLEVYSPLASSPPSCITRRDTPGVASYSRG